MWSDSSSKARKSKEPFHRLKALADQGDDPSPRNRKLPAWGCGLFRRSMLMRDTARLVHAGQRSSLPTQPYEPSPMAPVSQIVSKMMRKLRFRHNAIRLAFPVVCL
jgi:hypothetical protein